MKHLTSSTTFKFSSR